MKPIEDAFFFGVVLGIIYGLTIVGIVEIKHKKEIKRIINAAVEFGYADWIVGDNKKSQWRWRWQSEREWSK